MLLPISVSVEKRAIAVSVEERATAISTLKYQ